MSPDESWEPRNEWEPRRKREEENPWGPREGEEKKGPEFGPERLDEPARPREREWRAPERGDQTAEEANPFEAPRTGGSRLRIRPSHLPPLASRGSRFAAHLIDSLLMMAVFAPLFLLGVFAEIDRPADESKWLIGLGLMTILGLLLLIVQCWLLTVRGQTLGKIPFNIYIVDQLTGANAGFVKAVLLRSFVNNIIGQFCSIYYLVDALLIFNEDRQCIHDKLAGTVVVEYSRR